MNLANLIDGPSALIVFGGTLFSTVLRAGLEDCRLTLVKLGQLRHAAFDPAEVRAELSRQVQEIQHEGLFRAELHHLGDAEFDAATDALIHRRSISGLLESHEAYRPIRAVFAEQFDKATGLSTVRVAGTMRSTAAAVKEHNPDHPLADANGDVWTAPVDENAEMVEMLDASRQYQNLVEALSTAKQLMLDTMRMK